MVPDYGLSDLSTLTEDDDALNDDTFGGGGQTGWEWGSEETLELARLHEEFLQGAAGNTAQGSFFGDALDGANDFLLEEPGSLGLAGLDEMDDPEGDGDDLELLESQAQRLLDSAPGADISKGNRGLRVGGFPPTLDEVQVKQLLSHFGALASFRLERSAVTASAVISYEDRDVTAVACVNLDGIPMGAGSAPPHPHPTPTPTTVPSAHSPPHPPPLPRARGLVWPAL